MLVKELIHTDFKPISSVDTASVALEKMENYDLDLIPVIDHITSKYLGIISKKMMIEQAQNEKDEEILTEITQYPIKAYQNQHIFEVAGIMIRGDIKILPVVDYENNFMGVVFKDDVFKNIMNMLNLTEAGAVLGIEVEQTDFVLSDIIRIIEMEGVKAQGITVETPSDPNERVKVSIKLNMTDVSGVTSSLKRHGFVLTTESKNSSQRREYKDRADEFIRYLEM